ncbi:MAG: glutamine synthetase beta-grasp domain-containing protein [Actinomycetota bacterium]|nr:glutamine synthetase beta-grasp domain-containing protein [Actinomycetota bacterium]
MAIKAEYIWVDGTEPTAKLRSKTKILADGTKDLPIWGFDGSSTNQAPGDKSDCVLQPVFSCPDPIRGGDNILVMCEVLYIDMTPHETNTRRKCADVAAKYADQESIFGIEQEYTFFKDGRPYGFPFGGFPAPQGGYYCGVGADEVYGRDVVEAHMDACLAAGLHISGINAEVMPGQWEFQVGPVAAPQVADELWIARWLLYRIAEDFDISATLDPKPVKGDWNGAGAHTNFSTKAMRADGGYDAIISACEALGPKRAEHVALYGHGIEDRLTGQHETAPYTEYSYGVSNRGASVRIPWQVEVDKKGYMEDRRPNANCDPYDVCFIMIDTICSALA